MAAQAGLSLTWSETPKTDFLVTRLESSTTGSTTLEWVAEKSVEFEHNLMVLVKIYAGYFCRPLLHQKLSLCDVSCRTVRDLEFLSDICDICHLK